MLLGPWIHRVSFHPEIIYTAFDEILLTLMAQRFIKEFQKLKHGNLQNQTCLKRIP